MNNSSLHSHSLTLFCFLIFWIIYPLGGECLDSEWCCSLLLFKHCLLPLERRQLREEHKESPALRTEIELWCQPLSWLRPIFHWFWSWRDISYCARTRPQDGLGGGLCVKECVNLESQNNQSAPLIRGIFKHSLMYGMHWLSCFKLIQLGNTDEVNAVLEVLFWDSTCLNSFACIYSYLFQVLHVDLWKII